MIFFTRECIGQFLQRNSRFITHQIVVNGIVLFGEIVGRVEGAALEGGSVIMARGLNFKCD
jgi:hypothetical protein